MPAHRKPDTELKHKSSVWLTPELISIIQATFPEGRGNMSGRINTILSRYAEMVARSAPELTEAEWCAICEANNGTVTDDIPASVTMLWANVHDCRGLGEKWDVDAKKLVAKMRAWTYAESVACAEIVERFWSDTSQSDLHAWLLKCGAKIRD